jgi:adenylate cyclase
LAGRSEEALAVSAEGEQRAESGMVRIMMPELYRTRGNILRDLRRLDQSEEAYRLAVESARALGARSLEIRALTSLLDLRLDDGRPGDLPTELRAALLELPSEADRPDFIAANNLLSHISVEPHRRGLPCL